MLAHTKIANIKRSMINIKQTSGRIPPSERTFRFSRTAITLLLGSVALVVLLIISTLQNINRAQTLSEQFIKDKGETIMRSIEIGCNASMMHHIGSDDPIHELLAEYAKDKAISYITILDTNGSKIEHVGTTGLSSISEDDIDTLMESGGIVTKLDHQNGVYSMSKIFETELMPKGMHRRIVSQRVPGNSSSKILSIGLVTEQFDVAHQQDVRHTIFMGAILLLVGSASLYLLFLYQRTVITSSNLADMKLYTENIIESIPVGIITVDADDYIVSCNHKTEDLFGINLESHLGKSLSKVLPNCALSFFTGSDSQLEYETECRNSSGTTIPLRASCSPLINDEDKHIGKVLIFRDMCVIKEMEVQLERSRRMAALGKMAAGIAHEIRNPLGTLRGFAQYFGNQQHAGENDKQYSNLMMSEIDRLNETISALLQFSRLREPQMRKVNIDELMAKTTSLLEADLTSNRIELVRLQSNGIIIEADPDLLIQVLMNLVRNSIRALSGGGRIALSCRQEDGRVVLTVTDTGCGMSEDVRQRMFDPFFTTNKTATGLGLAICHQIVEQHGGVFEVQTDPQSGTTINVILPKK